MWTACLAGRPELPALEPNKSDPMAYNEQLAERVRRRLHSQPAVTERKMFGGLAFLVRGHMACGILNSDLMLRLGARQAQAALQQPHVREMDFTGRPMTGLVFVASGGLRTEQHLGNWVEKACQFVSTLPAREPNAKPRRRSDRQPSLRKA